MQQLVHQCGLAVINVGDDSDITNGTGHCESLFWERQKGGIIPVSQ